MRNSLIFILISLTALPAMAGFGEKAPVRWGKVSPAEFSIRPPGGDTAAPAMVLCDYGDIRITNRTFYSRHTRIRILRDEGMHYATVEIPFQTKDRHDDVMELRARTLVYENGKVTEYKVEGSQVETVEISDRWSVRKFTFPHVRPGVILEYSYTIASLDFENLDPWYFQREIPTLWSEIRFEVPEPFVYLVTFSNNRELSGEEAADYGRKLQWMFDTKPRARRIALARSQQLLYATPENRFKVWGMNDMKKKIIMKNMPALAHVQAAGAVTDYYPKLTFDLFESSGNLPHMFWPLLHTTRDDYDSRNEWQLMRDPMAEPMYVHYRLKTWDQFNTRLLENEQFGSYLRSNKGGMAFIDSITLGSRTPQAKMAAIYGYMQRNFRWNGEYAMLSGGKFDDLLKTRFGSSAALNLLLVNLLQRAGIQAEPLLVRTNDLGKPQKMYPVRYQFNHLIAAAEVDGQRVLLDLTSGSSDLSRLNRKDINTEGWLVNGEHGGWIEIYGEGTRDGGRGTREGQGTGDEGQGRL